ncbi:MAG TPA: BREX-6 system BrxE protein [Nannocystaceae bacterium]|nr:BREX-6 system BrxE protein [Nannocystaceae bacterium]
MSGDATKTARGPSNEAIDRLLTAQIAVAWAGEGGVGESPRLGWWRSDLVSEDGGRDLFERLLPRTHRWAVLQGVREVARRRDVELRAAASNPDGVFSLYGLGFEIDERAEERLQELKREGGAPEEALPGLRAVLTADDGWDPGAFAAWVAGHGKVEHKVEPLGRRLVGGRPDDLSEQVRRLVAALAPLGDAYPLPHFRGAR